MSAEKFDKLPPAALNIGHSRSVEDLRDDLSDVISAFEGTVNVP
jgi:hypothetical protein